VRLFLFFSGLWIFFSWGFRLYILWVRWETNPAWVTPLSFGLLFFIIGSLLIWIARLGERAGRRHYDAITASSLFIICYWCYRLARNLLDAATDPNPRSHLHLAMTFLVVGALLLATGLRGSAASQNKAQA
jgi:hypothetical protein